MSRTPMQFFEAISAIPRVSGNEKAVADFVEQLALAKGYEVRRDAMHNMVVVRPASPGCEHCDTFMMQGHLDMVAAAKEGVTHNFDTDPIELVRDGDLLRANGTTLGADDGVAVAYMLAILEDDSVVAPRLECVFTVQEEVGCRGAVTAANRLNPGWAIVLEGTTAADLPGVEPGKEVCRVGEGIVIPFMDRGTIYSRRVYEMVTSLAEKNGIPWQTKQLIAGGTDASAIQRSGEGVYVVTMAAPLRNIHSPASVGKISDLELLPVLCRHLLEEIANGY